MKKIDIPKNELKRLYEKEKLTTHQIAKYFKCCQATVWKRLHAYNIKPRKPYELYARIPPRKLLKELYINKGYSNWKIGEKYGYNRSTVYSKLKQYGIKIRTPAESHIRYPRVSFCGDLIEKAYLIGFSIGDLRVRKKGETISVECGSTKKEQLNLIKDLFKKYGHVWISKPNKKGAINIGSNLNLSFDFLLGKKMPTWILKKKSYFSSFLAGFTDAEGSIGIYGGAAVYQLGNYDNELLSIIHNKLNNTGIITRNLSEDKTKGYVSKDGYVRNQNYWHLTVGRKIHLLKLLDLIEPYLKHEKKKRDLNIARMNIVKRNKKYSNLMMRPKWRKNERERIPDKHSD